MNRGSLLGWPQQQWGEGLWVSRVCFPWPQHVWGRAAGSVLRELPCGRGLNAALWWLRVKLGWAGGLWGGALSVCPAPSLCALR